MLTQISFLLFFSSVHATSGAVLSNLAMETGYVAAFGEAAFSLCAVLFVIAVGEAIKQYRRKFYGGGASKLGLKCLEPGPSAQNMRPKGEKKTEGRPASLSASVPRRKTRSPATPARRSTETDLLAAAVRAGNAADLPRLLTSASRRIRDKGIDGAAVQEEEAGLLLSCLRACASHRSYAHALAAYDSVAERIGEGSSAIWSLLLYCATEAMEFHRCKDFFDRLRAKAVPSSHDVVNMVRYHVLRDPDGLQQTLLASNGAGLHLDAAARHRAVTVCVSKQAPELAALLLSSSVSTSDMDAFSYNLVMKAYAEVEAFEQIFKLYKQMRSRSILPSETTYTLVLQASLDAGDYLKAKQIFDDIRSSSLKANVVHYTSYMRGLLNSGRLDEASMLLEDMLKSPRTQPDLFTYSTLVKAYSDRGNVSAALRILKRMLSNGINPDAVVFNIVLTGCAVRPMEASLVLEVLDSLRREGLQPTAITLSVLIKAFAKTEAWDCALEILETAPERLDLIPEPRIFAQLAQACNNAGRMRKALQCYEALQRVGADLVTVDEAINSRLYHLCAPGGQLAAKEIFNSIKRKSKQAVEGDWKLRPNIAKAKRNRGI